MSMGELIGAAVAGAVVAALYYGIGFAFRGRYAEKQRDQTEEQLDLPYDAALVTALDDRFRAKARSIQRGFAVGGGVGFAAWLVVEEVSALHGDAAGGYVFALVVGMLVGALAGSRAPLADGPRLSTMAPRSLLGYLPAREIAVNVMLTVAGLLSAVVAGGQLIVDAHPSRAAWAVAVAGGCIGACGALVLLLQLREIRRGRPATTTRDAVVNDVMLAVSLRELTVVPVLVTFNAVLVGAQLLGQPLWASLVLASIPPLGFLLLGVRRRLRPQDAPVARRLLAEALA